MLRRSASRRHGERLPRQLPVTVPNPISPGFHLLLSFVFPLSFSPPPKGASKWAEGRDRAGAYMSSHSSHLMKSQGLIPLAFATPARSLVSAAAENKASQDKARRNEERRAERAEESDLNPVMYQTGRSGHRMPPHYSRSG